MWSEARDREERKTRTKARAVFIVGCSMRSDGEVVAVSQRRTDSGLIPLAIICQS